MLCLPGCSVACSEVRGEPQNALPSVEHKTKGVYRQLPVFQLGTTLFFLSVLFGTHIVFSDFSLILQIIQILAQRNV